MTAIPGFALVVSPKHTGEIKTIKDLANKKIGVSAPGSSTDYFLKYILNKNGVDPNSVGVIGVGSARPRSPRWSRARSTPPSCSIRR